MCIMLRAYLKRGEKKVVLGSAALAQFSTFCTTTWLPRRGCIVSAHSLSSPILEKNPPPRPSRGLPKGGECVETHISPRQMVVSPAILSHQPDCLPGLWPPPPPLQQATGIISDWIKCPQRVFKRRSILWLLSDHSSPLCQYQPADRSAVTPRKKEDSRSWLFLPFFGEVINTSWQLWNTELVK